MLACIVYIGIYLPPHERLYNISFPIIFKFPETNRVYYIIMWRGDVSRARRSFCPYIFLFARATDCGDVQPILDTSGLIIMPDRFLFDGDVPIRPRDWLLYFASSRWEKASFICGFARIPRYNIVSTNIVYNMRMREGDIYSVGRMSEFILTIWNMACRLRSCKKTLFVIDRRFYNCTDAIFRRCRE